MFKPPATVSDVPMVPGLKPRAMKSDVPMGPGVETPGYEIGRPHGTSTMVKHPEPRAMNSVVPMGLQRYDFGLPDYKLPGSKAVAFLDLHDIDSRFQRCDV